MRPSNGGKGDDRRPGVGYEEGHERIHGPTLKPGRLTYCGANRDGECHYRQCPQLCDGEPAASGRSCPLPEREES